MRASLGLVCIAPVLLAASAPVVLADQSLPRALAEARAEASSAEAEVRRLEREAASARDEAARLRVSQAAAAQAIAAAEARISAADAEARVIAAALAERKARLREQQRPASALLGGLVMMAERPPLLALAGGSDTDELVRVRLLLDSTLPVIRQRTAALARELAEGERLERSAAAARQAMARSRAELANRQRRFAELEAEAMSRAAQSGMAAIAAGDEALAAGEELGRLAQEAERSQSAARALGELAKLGPPLARPGSAGSAPAPPLDYRLPSNARVLQGLGEVSPNGVRSRGLLLATRRGEAVIAPAAGIVRFAGPFRDHDGVVIIDHGRGWMSLMTNVAAGVKPGERIAAGAPLGRAIGPLGVELSRYGQHWSPALIAGSSAALSNKRKGG